MMLNMLNVQITDRMTAGISAGLSDGRVMALNVAENDTFLQHLSEEGTCTS